MNGSNHTHTSLRFICPITTEVKEKITRTDVSQVCERAPDGVRRLASPLLTGSSFVRGTSTYILSYLTEARGWGEWGKQSDRYGFNYVLYRKVCMQSPLPIPLSHKLERQARELDSTKNPNRRYTRSNPRTKNGGARSSSASERRKLDAHKKSQRSNAHASREEKARQKRSSNK